MRIIPSTTEASALIAAKPKLAELKKATDGIESIFVKNLLSEMQKGTHAFGESAGADIYQDLMNQAISESIGKRGTLGISQMLYKQLAPRMLAQAEAQIRLGKERS